ncbi:MAG: hypothetical protein ABGY71_10575 [bacterium]|nr:hypothetical protein [Planctomycetota bacterium]HIL51035.1 hypothetical protein [Planctomycetota bacterium]
MTLLPKRLQQTEAPPARALGLGVLRTLYMDLLGRPPFSAEIQAWRGRGRREWLDSVLGSFEFWEHWLGEQLYFFFLIDNFRPTSEALGNLSRKLDLGQLSVRDAVHRIGLSSSFELRNPGADTFVTVAMEQFCGLRVEKNQRELEIGKSLYDGKPGLFLGRHGSSQSDVVHIAVSDKRFARSFVAREYERLVHQAVPKKALAGWARSLQREPGEYLKLVRAWVLSEDYDGRLQRRVAQSGRLFIRTLFVDLTDALPTPEEAEPLRKALDGLSDSAPLRSILVRLLLDSGAADLPKREEIRDPSLWVGSHYQRLLGREPRKSELDACVATLAHPEGRPETVLYALLTSAEYHRY